MSKKSSKIRIFETGLEKTARMLSNDYKIKVIWERGGNPRTDGNTIFIPALPEDASSELLNATHGYVDHESFHIIWTDLKSLEPVLTQEKQVLQTAWNFLEDCRIENKGKVRFPGTAKNLRNMNDYLNKLFTEPDKDGKTSWEKSSPLFKSLNSFYLWNAFSRNPDHWFWKDHVAHEYKQFVFDNIDILDRANAANSALEVVDIAKELLARMSLTEEFKQEKISSKQAKKQEKQEKDKEEGKDNQDSSGSDSEDNSEESENKSGSGSKNKQNKEEKEEESGSNGGKPESNDKDSEDKQDSSDNGEDESGSDNSNEQDGGDEEEENVTKTVRKVKAHIKNSDGSEINIDTTEEQHTADIQAMSIKDKLKCSADHEFKNTQAPYSIYTNEGDVVEVMESRSTDRSQFHNYESSISARARVVKRKIARALITATYTRWDYNKDKGKINRRSIHKVISGTSSRVFKQKGEDLAYDTAVLLLVDHSGSMHGHKMVTAMQTATLMGDVLSKLEIPFSVVGFSTNDGGEVGSSRRANASNGDKSVFARWGDLWLGIYKGFEDMWQHKKFKLAQMPSNVRSNTYDGESVRAGARILLARKEKRKILMLINDGQPCPNYCDDGGIHDEFAKTVGKEVGKYVELVAIGIGSDSIGNYYPKAININNVDELSGAVLNQLVRLLKPKI